MKLKRIEIEGYRSIKQPMSVVVDPQVTVVLGPNDHGKTNLLCALLHLNSDQPYEAETDLNWDSVADSAHLPRVIGTFDLSDEEWEWLCNSESQARDKINERIQQRDERTQVEHAALSDEEKGLESNEDGEEEPIEDPESIEDEVTDADEDLPEMPLIQFRWMKVDRPQAVLSRIGVDGDLTITIAAEFRDSVTSAFLGEFGPRFELISPITQLSDSATAADLDRGKNDFMRGIFYYADIEPVKASPLFEQNDRTQMALRKASIELNATLKESWSQGKDLRFELSHNSKTDQIELLIQDPSVDSRYVRASRRSSGFTHYFSLKTILYARQRDYEAHSYILLFDEPGVFLHPSGQHDLLQVMETLSKDSQIMYVTHSLFMINKTFPARHRLLMKDDSGTTLDGKPYVGRWQSVLTALGMTLTGSILFAQHVVLTEGDSDPLYLYSLFQKAVQAGKFDIDINLLGIISTSEARNTEVLLRLFIDAHPRPSIVVIVDGDKGGKERAKHAKQLCGDYEIPIKPLADGTELEDHLPMLREVYVPAVAAYVSKMSVALGKTKPDEHELEAKLVKSFDDTFPEGRVTQGVSDWAAKVFCEIIGTERHPSKVGIAREYAAKLNEIPDSSFKMEQRTKALLEWVKENAKVPSNQVLESKILE